MGFKCPLKGSITSPSYVLPVIVPSRSSCGELFTVSGKKITMILSLSIQSIRYCPLTDPLENQSLPTGMLIANSRELNGCI